MFISKINVKTTPIVSELERKAMQAAKTVRKEAAKVSEQFEIDHNYMRPDAANATVAPTAATCAAYFTPFAPIRTV